MRKLTPEEFKGTGLVESFRDMVYWDDEGNLTAVVMGSEVKKYLIPHYTTYEIDYENIPIPNSPMMEELMKGKPDLTPFPEIFPAKKYGSFHEQLYMESAHTHEEPMGLIDLKGVIEGKDYGQTIPVDYGRLRVWLEMAEGLQRQIDKARNSAEVERDKWVSVDTPPENGSRVLCADEKGDVRILNWIGGRWIMDATYIPMTRIVLWMPLPPPPSK